MIRRVAFVAVLVLFHWSVLSEGSSSCSFPTVSRRAASSVPTPFTLIVHSLRGGAGSKDGLPKSARKKKKKQTQSSTPSSQDEDKALLEEEKEVIRQAMREKDAVAALGDAIRERADQIRSELDKNPLLQRIDQSVSSVGFAMGTSDSSALDSTLMMEAAATAAAEDGGGVEASSTSVIANYFLKSHGGAHALQCICSLLATLSATAALLVSKSSLRLILMKRAMLFAMTKHISGLLAATSMTATAIPQVGLRKAKLWIQQLARDPISQYIFYASLIMLWLPSSKAWWMDGNSNNNNTRASLLSRLALLCLVGPILLREATSTAFVISDVLLLLTTSGNKQGQPNNDAAAPPRLVLMGQAGMNAFMSILVTPNVWRTSSAAEKQEILAKLASRTSLLLELGVGVLLFLDALLACAEFAFRPVAQRPSLVDVVKRCFCARLYVNFLWVRRRKIVRLGTQLRGGAGEFPFRVMELVLHPKSSMGIDQVEKKDTERTWIDYAVTGLGMD